MTASVIDQIPAFEVLDASHAHTFAIPSKLINEGNDLATFHISHAYRDLLAFIMHLNRSMFPLLEGASSLSDSSSVKTFPLNEHLLAPNPIVVSLRSLLDDLETLLERAPPDSGPRRFGNTSFRKWYSFLEEQCTDLLQRYVPPAVLDFRQSGPVGSIDELRPYLLGSFGSAQRLDYGTGHELSFLAFLGCIWKLGGFGPSPSPDNMQQIVIGVVQPYLNLIRKLIVTYTLEPAGTHGVWGLDDHSFIPYIFGSAQFGPAVLADSPTPKEGSLRNAPSPATITSAEEVERQRNRNMYFSAIGFIYDVKKGPFWEHSPTLYDISGIRAGWGKINKGMLKMYDAEVLGKFPVVQHFPFGSLFSFESDPNARPHPGTVHVRSQPQQLTNELLSSTGDDKRLPTAGTQAPWASGASAVNRSVSTFDQARSQHPSQAFPATTSMPPPRR